MFPDNKVTSQFMSMMDQIICRTEVNSELSNGIRWLDMQSRKKGITFYEMAYVIMKKYMMDQKLK